MGSQPIRIVTIAPDEVLSRVTKELSHRGGVYIVTDRTRKLALVSQSVAKIAAVIQRLVEAGVLDKWQTLHSQGIYSLLKNQIRSNFHKGWAAVRCELNEVPARLAAIRKDGYAQVAVNQVG